MHPDSTLIDKLGGPAAVAKLLGYGASYGDFWCMGDIEKVAYPAD